MGEVWLAEDTRLDRTVAVKVLPPELAADVDRRRCDESLPCTGLHAVWRHRPLRPTPSPNGTWMLAVPADYRIRRHDRGDLRQDSIAEGLRGKPTPLVRS